MRRPTLIRSCCSTRPVTNKDNTRSFTISLELDILGLVDSAMRLNRNSIVPDAVDEAVRLWMLASAFPSVPASRLLEVAQYKAHFRKVNGEWKIVGFPEHGDA